jgi:hypothetical protein
MIERMSEWGWDPGDDREVVSGIDAAARWEARAAAERLAAIHALMQLRMGDDGEDEREFYPCDLWQATAAEIGAVLGVSYRKASGQMCFAESMHVRLPEVFALLKAGVISVRTASTISFRTRDVLGADTMATIDRVIAEKAHRWGPLSDARLDAAIDEVLAQYDPAAVISFEERSRARDVTFGKRDDQTGTVTVWCVLYATDAEAMKKRVALMCRHLCKDDPRSAGERRSDAMGAISAGAGPLACRCGSTDCPGTAIDPSQSAVVIHVLADQAAIAAAHQDTGTGRQSAALVDTPAVPRAEQLAERSAVTAVAPAASESPAAEGPETGASAAVTPGRTPAAVQAPEPAEVPEETPAESTGPAPELPQRLPVAVLENGRTLPTPLLRELLRNGATLVPLKTPATEPEDHYRPSAALAAWVRARDMYCRFPGCTTPASACDIDHAVPYPQGPTHPSDLRCLCRGDHLLKTFYTGQDGWTDTQYPDGRIEWRAPTGHTYTTYPGSRIFFPHWDTTTATLDLPAPDPHAPRNHAGPQIPRRKRTRHQDRIQRIKNRRANRDTS